MIREGHVQDDAHAVRYRRWRIRGLSDLNSNFAIPSLLFSAKIEPENHEDVSLIFDFAAEWLGLVVEHESAVRLTFDLDSSWTGFWVPASNEPLLRFHVEIEWI
jgi:predicted permease